MVLTENTSGLRGAINIGVAPGVGEEVHGHLGYALALNDNSAPPTVGAYMLELTLSALDVSDVQTGPQLADSDPIFVIFNNQLSTEGSAVAVGAAEALPEPSTAMIVTAMGVGLIALRKRSHAS